MIETWCSIKDGATLYRMVNGALSRVTFVPNPAEDAAYPDELRIATKDAHLMYEARSTLYYPCEVPVTTVEGVRIRLKEIQALADKCSDAVAHDEQDDLYLDVLQAIAAGAENPAALAAEAAKVSKIEFGRWFS